MARLEVVRAAARAVAVRVVRAVAVRAAVARGVAVRAAAEREAVVRGGFPLAQCL